MSMGKTGFYSFGNRLQRVKGDDDSGTAHNWKTLLLLLSRPLFRDVIIPLRARGRTIKVPIGIKSSFFLFLRVPFPSTGSNASSRTAYRFLI